MSSMEILPKIAVNKQSQISISFQHLATTPKNTQLPSIKNIWLASKTSSDTNQYFLTSWKLVAKTKIIFSLWELNSIVM